MIAYTLETALLVLAAGALAGLLNAISSGGTLITYSALLLAGATSLEANATSAAGLLVGYISGTYVYRQELRERQTVTLRVPVLTGLGAIAGTVLLLNTDESVFRQVAPLLVLLATVLLIAQPHVARTVRTGQQGQSKSSGAARTGAVAFVCCGIYGAYFGAGMGILIMGTLGSFLPMGLHAANAWKNLLSLLVGITATSILVFSGLVDWPAAIGIAAASAAGAVAGVWVARRLPSTAIRWFTVAIGVGLSAALAVSS